MATVREIYQYLDGLAPFSLQMEFDNAGFLVGRGERAVSKILVSLDITEEVAEEAAELGAELVPDPVREKRLRQYLTAQGIDCRLSYLLKQLLRRGMLLNLFHTCVLLVIFGVGI